MSAAKFSSPASTAAARRCYSPLRTMAEASTTETKPKKPAKKKAPAAPPSPPPDTGWVTDWRAWGLLGGLLVFGVIAWKLLATSYKGDVQTICNAETESGFTLDKDSSKVTTYVKQHLGTPEGNQFFATLSDAKLGDRAKRLQSEATTLGIGSCPVVAAYEKLNAAGEYRADLQHLCSNVAFSHLAEVDDAARLQRLEDWIAQGARSPRTKELAEPLRQGTPADRAKLLRDAASKMDVFSCELAKTLEGPVVPPKGKGMPMVRPFGEPQIIGVMKPEDVAKALVDATPAMVECYKKGLEKKPDLEGKLAVKLRIDPAGKVMNLAPADETLPDKDTAMCILQVLKGLEFPKNPGPLVSVFLPLELTTSGGSAPGSVGGGGAGGATPSLPPLSVPPSLRRPPEQGPPPGGAASAGGH